MTPPQLVYHLEWLEDGDRPQERRFKKLDRCARQLAPIMAAPDAVAVLRGVWVSAGWTDDRIDWRPLDAEEVLASASIDATGEDQLSVSEWHNRIATAWRDHDQRSTT